MRISFQDRKSVKIAGRKKTASPKARPVTADSKVGFQSVKASMQPTDATAKSNTEMLSIEGKANVRTSL